MMEEVTFSIPSKIKKIIKVDYLQHIEDQCLDGLSTTQIVRMHQFPVDVNVQ